MDGMVESGDSPNIRGGRNYSDGLYIDGYSQDEIVQRVGQSKGYVNNIIQQLNDGNLPRFESISD